jgi:hypothetical protein
VHHDFTVDELDFLSIGRLGVEPRPLSGFVAQVSLQRLGYLKQAR